MAPLSPCAVPVRQAREARDRGSSGSTAWFGVASDVSGSSRGAAEQEINEDVCTGSQRPRRSALAMKLFGLVPGCRTSRVNISLRASLAVASGS